MAKLLAYLLIVAVMIVSFVKVEQAQNAIEAQTSLTQLQSIKNCVRANIVSALVRRPGANIDPLVGERLFPILDCKQSAVQAKLVPINRAEAKKYTALALKGRAPIINNGRVVGSRTSVLANVKRFDDLGKK